MSPTRRAILGSLGAVAVAGCLGDEREDLPEACSETQTLDVEWPEALDAERAEAFVETYAHVYFRDVVVEYQPSSRLDSYELSVSVDDVTPTDHGYELSTRGGGAIYTPFLWMDASLTEAPADAEIVPIDAVEDSGLQLTLEDAVENPDEDPHLETDTGSEVDYYIDVFDELFETYEPFTDPGDQAVLYFSVDGETVELEVIANRFHGDYGWSSWYYVDERVVYRSDDDTTPPREGELLECRDSSRTPETDTGRAV